MSVPLRKDEIELAPLPLKQEVSVQEVPASTGRKNRLLLATVGLSVGAGIALGLTTAPILAENRNSSTLRLLAVQTDANAPALESASADRRLGFVTISGSLRSPYRLNSTEAVVELLDQSNHTLRVERALVAQNIPGSAAPFQVMLPDDTRAASYRIYFQPLQSLATKSL